MTLSCTLFGSTLNFLQIHITGVVNYEAPSIGDRGSATVVGTFLFHIPTGQVVFASFAEHFTSMTASAPAAVILTPPSDTNPVDTPHTVTATVLDARGRGVPSVTVNFSVTGSVETQGSCTTNADGQCMFTYVGSQLPGADLIVAFVDNDQSGDFSDGDPSASATKAWLLPASTPGQVTGGGQINKSLDIDAVVFGFNAESHGAGFHGHCNVIDRDADVHIKCLDVTAMVVTPTHATIFGNATVNGSSAQYRIDVDDLGEPGKLRDTFSIITNGEAPEAAYSASGVLTQGNIQIHH